MKKEKTDIENNRIFYKIADIFEKLGNVSVKEYLEDFAKGLLTEEELEEELDNWSTNVFGTNDEDKSIVYLIEVKGGIYHLSDIFSLERKEKYSYAKNKMQYLLLMNRTENVKDPYGNTVFVFDEETEREKVINLIKDKLAIIGRKII